jgi:hypothetical protein
MPNMNNIDVALEVLLGLPQGVGKILILPSEMDEPEQGRVPSERMRSGCTPSDHPLDRSRTFVRQWWVNRKSVSRCLRIWNRLAGAFGLLREMVRAVCEDPKDLRAIDILPGNWDLKTTVHADL